MTERYANNFKAPLQAAITTANPVTLYLDMDPLDFPEALNGGDWRAKLGSEIVLVTVVNLAHISGYPALTISRELADEQDVLDDPTTAIVHGAGEKLVHIVTSGSLTAIIDDAINVHLDDTADAHDASAISFDPDNLPTNYISNSTLDVQTALEDLDARAGISSDFNDINIVGGDTADINLTAVDGATLLVTTSSVDIEAIDETAYIFGSKGVQLDAGTGGVSPNQGIVLNAQDGPIQLTGADVEVGYLPGDSQKLLASGGIGVGNSAAATTPGSVVKKMQVFDEAGNSLGYVAIYDTIT